MASRICLAILVALFASAPATAQSALAHIPSDALGGLVIRNLDDLAKRGDKLIEKTGMDPNVRISTLAPILFLSLGINAADVDLTRPLGIVAANPRHIDPKIKPMESIEKCLVLVLPIKSQEGIEKALKLEAGILKGGQVVKLPQQMGMITGIDQIALRDKHVYLGSNPKAIESISRTKGLGGELTGDQRRYLDRADLVLHLGTEGWGSLWKDFLGHVGTSLDKDASEEEKKVAKDFIEMLQAVKFGVASLRADDGIAFSLLSVFPKDSPAGVKKFLSTFAAGPGASTLNGLPEGNVIAAAAARGDGTQNSAIARLFFRLLVQEFFVPNRLLGVGDRPALLSVFNEVWERLRGSRLGLYKTADASEVGLFSLVGILDTEDPQKFLDELRQLARLGSADGLDFKSEVGKKASEEQIEHLIKDLGNRRFQVRASAEAKLALAGEQVLPYLEKAIKSPDLETRRRAERIKGEIVSAAEQARKEALSGQLVRSIKPSFVFLDKKEKVEGIDVQVVGVKLTKKDAAAVPQLKALLGPDWNRVRLAVHGKQVVALVGTDVGLFRKAIQNLKDDRPGLAASKALEGQAKQTAANRKVELHGSAQMTYLLATAADLEKPAKLPAAASLTSLTLSVEAERFQVDYWMPASEIKALIEAGKK